MKPNLLLEQINYYRKRANEYDEWFFRQGRYDRGVEATERWFREVEQVRSSLAAFNPEGNVLELAGGTGLWTELLAKSAKSLTVVDASPEVLTLNKQRVNQSWVKYVEADLFEWSPTEQYDVVLFGFWLSHVPSDRFEEFWRTVGKALKPDGRVFLVDSQFERESTAANHVLEDPSHELVTRKLNDGSSFQIFKLFYTPETLTSKLQPLGWRANLHETERFFLYGDCRLRPKLSQPQA